MSISDRTKLLKAKTNVKKHTKVDDKYFCNECEIKSSLKRDMKNHKEAMHAKVIENIQCDECGYIGSKAGLRQHKLLHKGIKLLCDRCDYTTVKSFHLKDHIKNVHEPEYVDCDECDFQCERLRRLHTHKKQVNEGKLFECNICEYKSKILDKMEDHKKGPHEGIKYHCDQCEYTCVFRVSLQNHKQVNHDEVRYACNVCEYKATRSGNLRAHERSVHIYEKRKFKKILKTTT